jgi:hypothetical protein
LSPRLPRHPVRQGQAQSSSVPWRYLARDAAFGGGGDFARQLRILSQAVVKAVANLVTANGNGLLRRTYSATLTRAHDGAHRAGKTVTFRAGVTTFCTAKTNTNAAASCRLTNSLRPAVVGAMLGVPDLIRVDGVRPVSTRTLSVTLPFAEK